MDFYIVLFVVGLAACLICYGLGMLIGFVYGRRYEQRQTRKYGQDFIGRDKGGNCFQCGLPHSIGTKCKEK